MSQNVTLILLCCCPLMALVGCLQWMTWHWETCLQWEPLLSPERVKQIQGSASQNSLFNVLVVLTHQSVWKGECLNYSDGQKKQLQLFITQIHLKAWFKTDEQSAEWVFWLPGDAKRGPPGGARLLPWHSALLPPSSWDALCHSLCSLLL